MTYVLLPNKTPLVDLVEANDQNVNIANDADFDTRIDGHETRITQNESDIATNTGDIATNTGDIVNHEGRITQNEVNISSNSAGLVDAASRSQGNTFLSNNNVFDFPIIINNYQMPPADGAAGTVMTTSGSGAVTFQPVPSGGSTIIKYVFFADSPFTITDGDGYNILICDTTFGDIIINLPTLADNQTRSITVINQYGLGLVTVDGEGVEPIGELLTVELPGLGDRIKIIGSLLEWTFLEEKISCQLRLDAYTGYGSTDNKIMQFANERDNYGNMFSENHSTGYSGGAEGLEVTINKSGVYGLTFPFIYSGSDQNAGISINSSQLTTSVDAINAQDRLTYASARNVGADRVSVSWQGFLSSGDIIRSHTAGTVPADANKNGFTAVYING